MTKIEGSICTIYKGSKKDELYLYVNKKEGLARVAEELLESMGELSEVMTLLIKEDKKLARVEAKKVLKSISEQGYFVQMPPALYPEAEKLKVFQNAVDDDNPESKDG